MFHNHEHHDCHGEHTLKLCKTCNIVYCANCHEEWSKPWMLDWLQTPYYTTPPLRGDTTTGTAIVNPSPTTCDHT